MISVGIDAGSKVAKLVILKDNEIVSKECNLVGLDPKTLLESMYHGCLRKAGISEDEVNYVIATGANASYVTFANKSITVPIADAMGINFLYPSVKTAIDVGAEEGRGIRCDGKGRLIDFVINERCAAGAGAFFEAMARALEVKLEDLGPLSLKSTRVAPINAQCTIFAESEVVTLIHQARLGKEDIALAINEAVAERIVSMVRRLMIEKDIALIGGVARNVGFVRSVEKRLGIGVIVPEDPEYIGALGAALYPRAG